MKRIMMLVLALLLLTGCAAAKPSETVEPPQTTSLKSVGTPWDQEGTLLEISLCIPSGRQYSNVMPFDGDLLLWSIDDHLQNQVLLELCLISLDGGSMTAQRDVQIESYAAPQALGEYLYICDNYSGTVVKLDKHLRDVDSWKLEANDYSWYYGGDGNIYQVVDGSRLWVYHLADGRFEPLLSGDPIINLSIPDGTVISLEYYHPDTGTVTYAALDLLSGDVIQPEKAACYGYVYAYGDAWLSSRVNIPFFYRYCSGDGVPVQFNTDECYVELLPEGKLLLTSADNQYLHLFDLSGEPISSCRISETGTCWVPDLIWNEELNGYCLVLYFYDNSNRLLFWDISQPPLHEPLHFVPIPELSAEEAALLHRCEEIGKKYGISILIGDACATEFFNFTAAVTTDWTQVKEELDVLEAVLDDYPTGFFRQLRRKVPQGVQIQLVRNIEPYEGSQYIDEYTAFVEDRWDCAAVVVDIERSDQTTYYHEFSHVIDSFLQWDKWEREDALFSEQTWISLNPTWFDGYTYDYSHFANTEEYDFFIDDYSTISPTEDRARIMEYAMADYGMWIFEDYPGLKSKLDYYCRCIRDAFNTDGWPEETLWEQYLNIGVG